MDFIQSDKMKWGIILLAVILIIGTMIDLYFSLSVRTFYLTKLYYPDIQDEIDNLGKKNQKAVIGSTNSYKTTTHKPSKSSTFNPNATNVT